MTFVMIKSHTQYSFVPLNSFEYGKFFGQRSSVCTDLEFNNTLLIKLMLQCRKLELEVYSVYIDILLRLSFLSLYTHYTYNLIILTEANHSYIFVLLQQMQLSFLDSSISVCKIQSSRRHLKYFEFSHSSRQYLTSSGT